MKKNMMRVAGDLQTPNGNTFNEDQKADRLCECMSVCVHV